VKVRRKKNIIHWIKIPLSWKQWPMILELFLIVLTPAVSFSLGGKKRYLFSFWRMYYLFQLVQPKSNSYTTLSPKQRLAGNTKEITRSQNKIFKNLFFIENIFVFMERFNSTTLGCEHV